MKELTEFEIMAVTGAASATGINMGVGAFIGGLPIALFYGAGFIQICQAFSPLAAIECFVDLFVPAGVIFISGGMIIGAAAAVGIEFVLQNWASEDGVNPVI